MLIMIIQIQMQKYEFNMDILLFITKIFNTRCDSYIMYPSHVITSQR